MLHGSNEVAAEAGYCKYKFHDESSRCDRGDGRSQHRDDRQDGIPQFMPKKDACRRQPFGLGGSNKVRIDDLQHRWAHESRKKGHRAETKHYRRHNHVRQGPPAGHREDIRFRERIHADDTDLTQSRLDETRHRNAKNHQEHDDEIG